MINYLETHLCDHCNLCCKGCSHFSGLVPPDQYKSIEDFSKEMRQLSKITNREVHTIRLMGGEPLLHPDVVAFCIITRELFPNSEIVLVSNGILLSRLTDNQIQILNNNNIELCLSDYGLKLNWAQINKFKIHYFHKKNMMYNISLDLSGSQNKEVAFNNCDLVNGGWYFFKNGRLFQCCIMANIDFFCTYFNKKIDYALDDISIDIFTHTEAEILDFLSHPHEACRYCDTIARANTYSSFEISKGDIKEWTI